MLQHVGDHAQQLPTNYGNVSAASIGAIQRGPLALEQQGAEEFVGEPMLNVDDLIQTGAGGRGIVNIPVADRLLDAPTRYSARLLWLLSEHFERLRSRRGAGVVPLREGAPRSRRARVHRATGGPRRSRNARWAEASAGGIRVCWCIRQADRPRIGLRTPEGPRHRRAARRCRRSPRARREPSARRSGARSSAASSDRCSAGAGADLPQPAPSTAKTGFPRAGRVAFGGCRQGSRPADPATARLSTGTWHDSCFLWDTVPLRTRFIAPRYPQSVGPYRSAVPRLPNRPCSNCCATFP